jgi:uncharacterized membrane protein YkvA (DUF1232 family)
MGCQKLAKCPIDDKDITMWLPHLSLRYYCSRVRSLGTPPWISDVSSRFGKEKLVEEYNIFYSSKCHKYWIISNCMAAIRLHFDLLFVDFYLKICYYLSILLIYAYILWPYDLIPEGNLGFFFIMGLLDDFFVAFFVVIVLGSLYRYHVLNKGLQFR